LPEVAVRFVGAPGVAPPTVTEATLESPPRFRPLIDWSWNWYWAPGTRRPAVQEDPVTGHGSCEKPVSPSVTFLT
jgi:hypothetical protein